MKRLRVGGEGQAVEIDAAYFGGHVRPENRVADRVDRRLAGNKPGKRRVVAAMRERGGRTLTQVFAGEDAAVPAIRQRIARGTVVHADESPAWNPLPIQFACAGSTISTATASTAPAPSGPSPPSPACAVPS